MNMFHTTNLTDVIHRRIGMNLTDVFIMSLLQKKHDGLFFLLPSKITTDNDYSRWKFDGNVPSEMINDCKSLIENVDPRIIVINLSRSKHRNLIIIDVEKEILTFFDPNTCSSDIITSQEYREQEETRTALSENIFSAFRSIFPGLTWGLIWRNVSAVINFSVKKSNNSTLYQSRLDGWCTLDSYAFLDVFVDQNVDSYDNDVLFHSMNGILEKLTKFPDILTVYQTNQMSLSEVEDLLPQLKIMKEE